MDRLTSQQAAEPIDETFQDLETLLMRNIARHIWDYDQPIPTDEWLLRKMAEIGKFNRENIRIISRMAGISGTAAERMLEDMAEKTLAELEPGFRYLVRQRLIGEAVPSAKSKNVKQVVRTLKNQAKDVQNLSNTTMLYKARDAYKGLIQDIADKAMQIAGNPELTKLLNEGVTAAVIGAESRTQALRRCIKRFAEKGIAAFVDSRGHEWTPEAYINMCMRTTSQKMATEIQMARADDHGIDLIEISSHAGARPRCAPYQGRIFDRANKSTKYPHWNTTSYGEPAGLFGINCGHHGYPYIEGVSIRRYFPTDNMDANDKLYRETQKQRALERAVRKQKRECMLYDELGDEETFEEAAVKLKVKEAELKYFVDGNNQLHRRKDREQVVGFDKRISAEAVGTNKKVQKRLAEKARDDTIKSEIKAVGVRGQIELHPSIPDVHALSFDDKHINKQRNHSVTEEEAKSFINNAKFSTTRWNGKFTDYFSEEGAAYVNNEASEIRTAFKREQYDDSIKSAMEMMKNGKR